MLCLLIFNLNCLSQDRLHQPSTVFIHGKVLNNKSGFAELGITGYFHSYSASIPIEKDGSFSANIATDGLQDLYLDLDNGIVVLFAQPGDTIQLNWNGSDPVKTITAASPDPDFSRGLQLCVVLSRKYIQPFRDLMQRLADSKGAADSLKFTWINQIYNEEIRTAMMDTVNLPSSIHKILNDIYYRYAGLLLGQHLLDSYSLKTQYPLDSLSQLKKARPFIKGVFPTAKTLNKEIFLVSDVYRKFLYNYIQSKALASFNNFDRVLYTGSDTADKPHWTPLWNEYYTFMSNMSSYPIRDWMITQSIIFGFEYYSFDEAESVYRDFLTKCVVKQYRDTLINFYSVVKNLKQGNMAPDFTLRDTAGKNISLHDLKGKIVYLDFWGVNCGPCIRDIKDFVPGLHKKYKGKDILFVNICVCGGKTEPGWKHTIGELGLEGVNLLAPGWAINQVCKSYNVIGIPHYVLIDQQGRIVSANAQDPGVLTGPSSNEIDKLLGK